jgi:WD40 repeat protein
VQFWDAQSGDLIGSFADHLQDIWAIKFSPDARSVATGGTDYTLKLWRWDPTTVDAMNEIWRTDLPKVGFADMFAFSPDGAWLVTGGDDKNVRVWSANDGSLLYSLGGHTGQVFAVAFSAGGKFFASAGEDTTIRLWDATQDPPRELYKLRGHTGLISSLAFSPDCGRLVSGSRDRTVKIWDLSIIFAGAQ